MPHNSSKPHGYDIPAGLEKHQNYEAGSIRARLVSILNRYLAGEAIPAGRGCLVNRRVLSKELGVTPGNMTRYLQILLDYERHLAITRGVAGKLVAIESWIDEAYNRGDLQLINGLVQRTQVLDTFNIQGANLNQRYPELGKLFARWDKKVSESGYLPRTQRENIESLRVNCASDDFFSSGGKNYAYNRAAHIVGVSAQALRRPPYSVVVAQICDDYRERVSKNALIFVHEDRDYSFLPIVRQGYHPSSIARVTKQFGLSLSGKSPAWRRDVYERTLRFFEWLSAQSTSHAARVRVALFSSAQHVIDENDWALVHQEHGAYVRSQFQNQGTANAMLTACNAAFNILAEANVVPTSLIPYRKSTVVLRRYRPSVAEAAPISEKCSLSVGNVADAYLAFATQKFDEMSATHRIDMGSGERNEFLETLKSELERGGLKGDQRPDKVIGDLIDRRLGLIEARCYEDIKLSREALARGDALVMNSRPSDDYYRRLFSPDVKRKFRPELRDVFPLDNVDVAIGNLLRLVSDRYNAVYPARLTYGTPLPEGDFFHIRAREFGNTHSLQAMLLPTSEASASILTIYLAQSASNIAVGRRLATEDVENSQERGQITISGLKMRVPKSAGANSQNPEASGKPIHAEFDEKSPFISALRWLIAGFDKVRKVLPQGQKSAIFLVRVQGAIRPIDEGGYRSFFDNLIMRIPELAGLNITPSMLRPSRLLLEAIRADGSLRKAVALGQHVIDVDQGYTNDFPTQYVRDLDIREFTDLFEAITLDGTEVSHRFIGMDAVEFRERLQRATSTGMGFLCADRKGRPQSNGDLCTQIDCWKGCPQLIVIAREFDVALLQLWQRTLRDAEAEWVRDRPERWIGQWLPWLQFVDMVEENMRVAHAIVWRKGKILAERILSQPGYRPLGIF